MILDANLAFATDTVPYQVTNAASTNSIGPGAATNINVIDLGVSGLPASIAAGGGGGARDIALGDQFGYPKVVVNVLGQFSSAGTTTAQIVIQGAPDSGTGTPGSFTNISWGPIIATVTSGAVQAGGQAGAMWEFDLGPVPNGVALPRYLQAQLITTGTGTAGASSTGTTLSAWLVLDTIAQVRSNTVGGALSAYPPGVTVSN